MSSDAPIYGIRFKMSILVLKKFKLFHLWLLTIIFRTTIFVDKCCLVTCTLHLPELAGSQASLNIRVVWPDSILLVADFFCILILKSILLEIMCLKFKAGQRHFRKPASYSELDELARRVCSQSELYGNASTC
jgi:hypothetical protein